MYMHMYMYMHMCICKYMYIYVSIGEISGQIWVLPRESDRYRTRQVVVILARSISIQLDLV